MYPKYAQGFKRENQQNEKTKKEKQMKFLEMKNLLSKMKHLCDQAKGNLGMTKNKISEPDFIKPLKLKQKEIKKNSSLVTIRTTLVSVTWKHRDTKI